ncbi:cadherin domain protein [Ancylostoma caninum]|uniref:Cadherin domain protein n=1 Tax=Ancylostoma caninum TaxID=29170 RepID=A0A368G124_ANCCA|nr:cadherin domain protein [Ancylostoma caninum]
MHFNGFCRFHPPMALTNDVRADSPPTCTKLWLHPSTVDFALIESGATAGKTIAVLTVTDEDGPLLDSSPVSIESGNEDGVFDLNVQKHFSILKLAKNAENIDRSEYDLRFIATDGQLPERKTRKTLKVFNGAKLTTSPVVVERELSASIPENSPIGTFIAQVHTNSSGCRFALQTINYRFFSISGIITTTATFDVNNASTYTLEIMVQLPPPSVQSVISTVTVTIMDVNDHAPAFTGLPNRLSISEYTPVGTTVLAIKASDADRGENSRVTYRLMNDRASEFLSIDKHSGKVTLRKTVDFEKIQRFDMVIEACDSGTPKLCSTADLPVLVEDVNDNSPEFPCPTVHTVLPVSSPPGTVVATVFAEDRDAGTAGGVYYALLDAITGFSIDRSTGSIRTTEKLQEKEYRIRIGAMDGNGVMSTNNATVTLLTRNGNLLKWTAGPDTIELKSSAVAGDVLATYETNPPSSIQTTSSLLSIDGQGRLTITLPIPIDIDRFYALLLARSGDVSISKCVQIRMIRDLPAPAFPKKTISMKLARDSPLGMEIIKVDPGVPSEFKTDCRWLRVDSTGVVSIKELIDKSIDSVQCAVEAWDSMGRRDALKMHITLERTEEPLRLNATYNLHVNEGTRPGAVLLTLATDPIYVFRTTLDTPIGVFPDGTVYVKREILKGIADVISVPVMATHRHRNNTYATTVHVYIDDVNNHAPMCPERNQFWMRENARIGNTIGFLNATEEDSGLNGIIGYRLLDSEDLLRVETSTGKVTSGTVFDAESLSSIDFKYEVFDHGSPPNTAICNGTVFIVDVNDNAPDFEQRFYTSKVDINIVSDNRTIVIVKAVDRDVDDNVTYRLLNYQHLFEINSTSGEISRKGQLRGDSRFNVSIAAIDSGGKRAETFLLVSTSTDNEQHPVFDEQLEPFRISRSTEIGAIIGRVRAVAGSHVIKYHIHRFDIDSWGNVILTGQLAAEGSHDIVVTASTPFRNATTMLKISITHDLPASNGVFRIEENSVPKVITKLGDGYRVLLIVPASTAFAVKERQLVLTSPLDRESSPSYQILVGDGRYE